MDFLKRLFSPKPANAQMNVPVSANIGATAPKVPEAAPAAVVGGKRRTTRRRKHARNTRKNNRK